MMIRKIAFTCLFGLSLFAAKAQQEGQSQSTHFMINPYLVNPALSGAEDFVDLKLGTRLQWVGVEGAPRTYSLSAHTPIGKTHGALTHVGDYHNWHGVGALAYQHTEGPLTSSSAYLNYAYNIKITDGEGFGAYHKDGIRLALGTFLGLKSFRWDTGLLGQYRSAAGDAQNTAATQYLELNQNNFNNSISLDASFGALFYFRDIFYFGASTFQLIGNKTKFDQLSRHFYIHGAWKFEIQDHVYLIPAFLAKKVQGAPMALDVNLRLDYHDKFFGGLSFRGGGSGALNQSVGLESISIMAGALLEFHEKNKHFRKGKHRYGLEIYYSYDITSSLTTSGGEDGLGSFSNGSHEITLGWRIPPIFRDRNAI